MLRMFVLVASCQLMVLLAIQACVFRAVLGTVMSIFLAGDWSHVRRVSIEIRPANAKLLAVRIDPFPEDIAVRALLRARLAAHAHKISRKPVAVATMRAPTMI